MMKMPSLCFQAFLYDLEKVTFAPNQVFITCRVLLKTIVPFTGDQSSGEIHTTIRISNQQGKVCFFLYAASACSDGKL